jgi:GNAT superfamily N-acetyltransferase
MKPNARLAPGAFAIGCYIGKQKQHPGETEMNNGLATSFNGETIELQAMQSWFKAVSRASLSAYDWRLESVGDALCSVCAADESILINRVLGLGSRTAPTLAQLVSIRRLYRRSGIGKFFLHLLPQLMTRETEQLLTKAGYQRYRGWVKFVRDASALEPASTDLTIRKISPAQAADFATIAGPAFDMDPASQPAIASMVNDPNWHLFMSFEGGQPAGTGALFVNDGIAYTDWGATHPDFRRRGSQTAILNTRIQAAIDMGCTEIVTMTGEAVPGDPQHSYNNILKRGFKEAYLRENWIPVES